ncbi:MAG: hypothetical protein ACXWNG_06510 [Candidatus Limnocylindrales bacterium]
MRSIRSLIVVAVTLLAVSGCSASAAGAAHKTFRLDKTCTHDAAGVPTCTIVSSDIAAIPAGTVINYKVVGDGSTRQKYATITVKDGTASGFCDFNHDGKPLAAQCTFLSGTGALTGFHLVADVTLTGDGKSPASVWHWNGTYWFGD